MSFKFTRGYILIKTEEWNSRHFGHCRGISIYSPWTSGEADVIIIADNSGTGISCSGESDFYCNIDADEAEIFAWEINLGCKIIRSFDAFWNTPQDLIELKPPFNLILKIENKKER